MYLCLVLYTNTRYPKIVLAFLHTIAKSQRGGFGVSLCCPAPIFPPRHHRTVTRTRPSWRLHRARMGDAVVVHPLHQHHHTTAFFQLLMTVQVCSVLQQCCCCCSDDPSTTVLVYRQVLSQLNFYLGRSNQKQPTVQGPLPPGEYFALKKQATTLYSRIHTQVKEGRVVVPLVLKYLLKEKYYPYIKKETFVTYYFFLKSFHHLKFR